MRQLQKKIKNGTLNIKQDDPFELFVAATNIRYCYYNETHKILGNTFGMCVLQVGAILRPGLESALGGAGLSGSPGEQWAAREKIHMSPPLPSIISGTLDHFQTNDNSSRIKRTVPT